MLPVVDGYDLWAPDYDTDDNLLLSLEGDVFSRLIAAMPLRGKVVIDVGCGTGRHWPKLLAQGPARLTGYDVSPGMLAVLRDKLRDRTAHQVSSHTLEGAADGECDVVLSTLTLAHFPDVDAALTEWTRVLCPHGDIVLTDLHPAVSTRGGCTFEHDGETLTIQTYTRPESDLRAAIARARLDVVRWEERGLDPSMREHYASRGALRLYEALGDRPLVLGLHLRKAAS